MPEPPPAPLINTPLPSLDLPFVQMLLQRDGARLGQGRGLLAAHAGRHWRQRASDTHTYSANPPMELEDVGEHVVAWLESRSRRDSVASTRPAMSDPGGWRGVDAAGP